MSTKALNLKQTKAPSLSGEGASFHSSMKKILLILLIILIGLGGQAQKKWSCIAATKKIVQQFEKNKFGEICLQFNASLKEVVDAQQLEQIWQSECKQGEGFLGFGTVSESSYNSRPVGRVLCKMKTGNKYLVINYTTQGQVSGLFFQTTVPQ